MWTWASQQIFKGVNITNTHVHVGETWTELHFNEIAIAW